MLRKRRFPFFLLSSSGNGGKILQEDLYASLGDFDFSRNSIATIDDLEPLIQDTLVNEARFRAVRRVENLLQYSEDFTQLTGGSQLNTTASATNVTFDVADGSYRYKKTLVSYPADVDLVARVKVRSLDGRSGVLLRIYSAGLVDDEKINVSLTPSWVTYAIPISTNSAGVITIGVDNRASEGATDTSTTGSVDISEWQIEEVTGQANQNPSEYVSSNVLPTPWHGAGTDNVQYFPSTNNTTYDGSNVVTDADGTPLPKLCIKGLLVEASKTNLALYSEQLFIAPWVTTNTTIHVNIAVSPDGRTLAESLTADASNATTLQTITSAINDYVFTIYLKRKTGSGSIDITLDGSTWTTVAVDSTWQRFEVRGNTTNPVVGVRIQTDTDAVYAWGAQLEIGDFASSYIPTTSIAVTREADDVTIAKPSSFLNEAGTIAINVISNRQDSAPHWIFDFGNATGIYQDVDGNIYFTDGTNVAFVGTPSDDGDTIDRIAVSWGGLGVQSSFNGGTILTTAFDGSVNSGATLYLGKKNDSSSYWDGTLRDLCIFKKQLLPQQINDITTIYIVDEFGNHIIDENGNRIIVVSGNTTDNYLFENGDNYLFEDGDNFVF